MALTPPYDHTAQAIDRKKMVYGASISFQKCVDGKRHGEKKKMISAEAPIKAIPIIPCSVFPCEKKIMESRRTQMNPPAQPAIQPIFSPILLLFTPFYLPGKRLLFAR